MNINENQTASMNIYGHQYQTPDSERGGGGATPHGVFNIAHTIRRNLVRGSADSQPEAAEQAAPPGLQELCGLEATIRVTFNRV